MGNKTESAYCAKSCPAYEDCYFQYGGCGCKLLRESLGLGGVPGAQAVADEPAAAATPKVAAVLDFPTHNVSLGQAVSIVKNLKDNPDIAIQSKVIAIEKVARMETHNSITKDELVGALRWLFDHYDF